MTAKGGASAFEQGQIAGRDLAGRRVENPFPEGSPEHNNFEVGRRFGAANSGDRYRPNAAALTPDHDEDGA